MLQFKKYTLAFIFVFMQTPTNQAMFGSAGEGSGSLEPRADVRALNRAFGSMTLDAEGRLCCKCGEELSLSEEAKNPTYEFSCGHRLHKKCIRRLRSATTCPTCKQEDASVQMWSILNELKLVYGKGRHPNRITAAIFNEAKSALGKITDHYKRSDKTNALESFAAEAKRILSFIIADYSMCFHSNSLQVRSAAWKFLTKLVEEFPALAPESWRLFEPAHKPTADPFSDDPVAEVAYLAAASADQGLQDKIAVQLQAEQSPVDQRNATAGITAILCSPLRSGGLVLPQEEIYIFCRAWSFLEVLSRRRSLAPHVWALIAPLQKSIDRISSCDYRSCWYAFGAHYNVCRCLANLSQDPELIKAVGELVLSLQENLREMLSEKSSYSDAHSLAGPMSCLVAMSKVPCFIAPLWEFFSTFQPALKQRLAEPLNDHDTAPIKQLIWECLANLSKNPLIAPQIFELLPSRLVTRLFDRDPKASLENHTFEYMQEYMWEVLGNIAANASCAEALLALLAPITAFMQDPETRSLTPYSVKSGIKSCLTTIKDHTPALVDGNTELNTLFKYLCASAE